MTKRGDKPSPPKRAKEARSEEFDRFDELAQKLVKVPKPEVDEAVKKAASERRRSTRRK